MTDDPPEILIIYKDEGCAPCTLEEMVRRRGIPYATVSLQGILHGERPFSFRIMQGAAPAFSFMDFRHGRMTESASLRGVWAEEWRLPRNPLLALDKAPDVREALEVAGISEAHYFAGSFLATLSRQCLLLPQVGAHEALRHPMVQKTHARNAGFKLPPACMGYYQDYQSLGIGEPGRTHYQPLFRQTFRWGNSDYVMTDRWISEDRFFVVNGAETPSILSKRPENMDRLYVAGLGADLWALKVGLKDASQAPDVTDLFYHRAHGNLLTETVTVSDDVRTLCRDFMRETGLVYCNFDILLEDDGTAWFLDAHPQGGMRLFEEAGHPVVERLADMLVKGGAR